MTISYKAVPFKKVPKINDYKSSSYEDTNHRITQILERFLKDIGIGLEILSFQTFINDLWISKISLISEKEIVFLTSGKGRGLNASIASGLGEMMERIQAGFLYFKNYNNMSCFYSKKDIPTEMLLLNEKFNKIIRKNCIYLPTRDMYYDRYIPMQEMKSREKFLINSRYFCRSTGFASGNTYEEAILQALCEVFERSCAFQILSNKRECPTIPLKNLDSQFPKYMQQLKEKGISIKVKDLSLSKGFPVVGVLFHHESLNMYEFGVGSATNVNHALERCIIEYLQIERNINQRVKDVHDYIEKHKHFYKIFPSIEKYLPFQVLMAFNHSFHGFFPSEGLTFLTRNNETYQKWDYSHKNMVSELKNILKLLDKNRYHVYMKDYNRMGFPTVKVIIPELHTGRGEHSFFISKEIRDFKTKLMSNMKRIKSSELDILLDPEFLIYTFYNSSISRFFNSMIEIPNCDSMWEFFIALSQLLGRSDIAKLYTSYFTRVSPREISVQSYKNKENILKKIQVVTSQCPSCPQCSLEKCEIKQHKNLYIKLVNNKIYPLRWMHI